MAATQRRMLLTLTVLYLLVAGALATACGKGQPKLGSLGRVSRFVNHDPQAAQGFALDWTAVREWSFSSRDDLEPWSISTDAEAPRTSMSIDYDLGLAAEDIDVIRVNLASAKLGLVAEIFWKSSAKGFSGTYALRSKCHTSYKLHRCEASFRDRPEWIGKISWLRIRFDASADDLVVQGIRLMKHSATLSDEMARAVQHGTKIDLAGDVRNAFPALPGVPLERKLRIPPGSKLRFAHGRPLASLAGPVAFRVSLASGPTLYQAVTQNARRPRWHEAEIDLAELSGKEVVLRMEVEASSPTDIAFWSNPEVTTILPKNPPPNILLISIDTLRPDRLSLYGYHRRTSPYLDAWAESKAAVFQSAVAQAPWTLPSHVSMFTGLNPNRHESNQTGAAGRGLTMLPEILRDAGYATLGITGGAFLHPQYGFTQGFDRYYYHRREKSDTELKDGTDRALLWLDQHKDRPFFLFFHTYEVHDPYRPRQPHYRRFTDLPPIAVGVPPRSESEQHGFQARRVFSDLASREEFKAMSPEDIKEIVSAAYDSSIAYADEQINRLLGKLTELEIEDNTIVVITSDHGELLGEHDRSSHMYLFEENILVPLIIAAPDGRGAGRVIPNQVRSIDILPTILDLADLPPLDNIDGYSLAPLLDGKKFRAHLPAFTYAARSNNGISVRLDNQIKYIYCDSVWPPVAGSEQVLSLLSAAGETGSVATGPTEPASRFRPALSGFFNSLPGLWIHFRNGGDTEFSGELIRWSGKFSTKSIDMRHPYLERHPGRTVFHVPPGESYSIVLLTLRSRVNFVLTLQATAENGNLLAFKDRIHYDQLDDTRVVGLAPSGWKIIDSDSKRPETSVTFRWQGGDASSDLPSVEIDEALRAQLQALGYLGDTKDTPTQ